jgi:small-conductance mechanosensitive channel
MQASVANASVIDNALEKILNIMFWFVLSLMLLSILQFNPYPILVSITSLLVSISFALGSSVSKYVEGILLIAIRRPFDLGDRIFLAGAESPHVDPGAPSSWFVEDISLFSTTLRFAKTNEVSSVNNFSISQSRIVNLQRSTNAIVQFELRLSIKILKDDKLNKFREALEEYVNDRPRIWDSFAFCRHDLFDPDFGFVLFTLAFRHRLTWQSAARINLGRADLMRFIYELCIEMGIQYETPIPQRHIIQETITKSENDNLDNFDPAGALAALEGKPCESIDDTAKPSGSEYLS